MLIKNNNDLLDKLNENIFSTPLIIKNKNWLVNLFVPKNCVITLGNTVYANDKCKLDFHTIMHEAQHYADQCTYNKKTNKLDRSFITSILFYFTYSLPQILGLFSFLALLYIFYWYMIFFLIFIFFFLPNPHLSSYRFRYELRGYFWNYYAGKERKFSRVFNSWTYYKMDVLRTDTYYINLMEGSILECNISKDIRLKLLLDLYKKFTFIR